jgi:hypothetical protein
MCPAVRRHQGPRTTLHSKVSPRSCGSFQRSQFSESLGVSPAIGSLGTRGTLGCWRKPGSLCSNDRHSVTTEPFRASKVLPCAPRLLQWASGGHALPGHSRALADDWCLGSRLRFRPRAVKCRAAWPRSVSCCERVPSAWDRPLLYHGRTPW